MGILMPPRPDAPKEQWDKWLRVRRIDAIFGAAVLLFAVVVLLALVLLIGWRRLSG